TSSVDRTNNADLAGGGTGAGAGPEAAAVTTNIAAPGTTTRFSLFVNNTSAAPDNYNLAASTDSGFAALTLPADWSVIFRNLAGAVITNTGNIAAGASVEVYADITLPADAPAATSDIYFRSLSPNTGAVDIKHDAVTVGQITDIVLTPDNQGQVLPGGVVIYSHWLSNQANMDQADITLTHVNDQPGWASDLYADTDGDGVLSGGDTRLTTVASLPSGASMLIFDKVLAPASAPMGTDNLTVITASWNGGADSTQAQDLTTTNRSDVKIVKLQALDTDCNGGADFAFSYDNFAAEPGQCVMYQLTATNTGVEQMQNVQIHDATPAYTHFYTAGGLPILSQGSLSTPISNGLKGDISGAMGVLNPGNSAVLTFGIQIE
ncbi:MAG TPA: hypothetical protein PLN94_14185, partial [Thiolinea sp.]|nr:hypothetical protein [Thiolinea sp.]